MAKIVATSTRTPSTVSSTARSHLPAALALSRREAARLLGVDRGATLSALIAAGRLRLVPWGSGERIPLVDVQRLAQEGWTTVEMTMDAIPKPRRRRGRPRAVDGLTDADLDREVQRLLAG